MNLPRLRELMQMGKDGSIRSEELKELFEVLPKVMRAAADLEPLDESLIMELATESMPHLSADEEDVFSSAFAAGWRACEARWQRRV